MKIDGRDIQSNGENGYFSVRTAGICFVDGKILLHKKLNDEFWNTVGGRVKLGESSEDALKREFKEELDVEIKILNLNSVVENFFEFSGKPYHEIIFLYNIGIKSELKFPIAKDDLNFAIFSLDEIASLDIRPNISKNAIINALNKNSVTHLVNVENI